jgi:predicted Zn-dependent protease with MMP-like domain
VLEGVAVVVSDLGSEHRAYGEYFGDGIAREGFEDRIVIYRDTLERDFGHDRRQLARQVEQTLRHELAHHLGWDETGVGGLGL